MLKQGKYRAERWDYPDDYCSTCGLWEVDEDENPWHAFQFPASDIDMIIRLLKRLKREHAEEG